MTIRSYIKITKKKLTSYKFLNYIKYVKDIYYKKPTYVIPYKCDKKIMKTILTNFAKYAQILYVKYI